MKQKIKDIAYMASILTIIALCAFLFFFVKTESMQCIASPLTYGVSQYKASQGEFTCTCSSQNSPIIFVTKDNISISDYFFEINSSDTFIK